MEKKLKRLRRVYVWELPVRFYHWFNALAILVLIVTGFWIANPPALQSNSEPYNRFLMAWVKFIHYIAAYVFLANFIFRIYWGFVGNKYARWNNFIPSNMKFLREIGAVLRIDVFLQKGKEHLSVGHNALAGFVYFGMFLFFVIQCITGFGLYADMSEWWFPRLFAWVPAFVGGDAVLRQIHHATMWFFIIFIVIHVYLVMYHDYVEGRGEVSSMFGGWKFIEEEVFEKQQEAQSKTHSTANPKTDEVVEINEDSR